MSLEQQLAILVVIATIIQISIMAISYLSTTSKQKTELNDFMYKNIRAPIPKNKKETELDDFMYKNIRVPIPKKKKENE